jgi:hypothetical protein
VEEYQAVLLEPVGGVTVEATIAAPEGSPGALRCPVADRFPDDNEVATVYAEALMNLTS